VPREDADEFRASDVELCALCDNRKAAFQTIVWSPTVLNPKSRRCFSGLRKRIANWFNPVPHELAAPVSRPC
jgi:hypothetical protein